MGNELLPRGLQFNVPAYPSLQDHSPSMAAQVHVDPTLVVCSGVPLRSSWLQVAAGGMFDAAAVGENSKATAPPTGANKRKGSNGKSPFIACLLSRATMRAAGTARPLQSDDSGDSDDSEVASDLDDDD